RARRSRPRRRPPPARPGWRGPSAPPGAPAAPLMPAEWERHEATWLTWPHRLSDWPGRFAPIPWVYGEIVRKLAEGEIVRIVVPTRTHEGLARRALKEGGGDTSRVGPLPLPVERR